jgi:hypothetical protein
MGKPLAITRIEHTAEDLRAIASKSRDGAQVRRLLALASVLGRPIPDGSGGSCRDGSPNAARLGAPV